MIKSQKGFFKKGELKVLAPFYVYMFIAVAAMAIFPFMVIYFRELGFSFFQYFILFGAWTSSTVLFEVPTGAVADAIEDLTDFVNDPAQNPAAVALVQDALDELNGNGEGKANDGVLDMLEKDNWNAALVKLSKAIELLEEADPSTDVDLSIAVSQLVLSAKSIMVDLLGKAQADATKPEDYQKIADAEALIAEGDQLFADHDAVAAVEAYCTVLTRL